MSRAWLRIAHRGASGSAPEHTRPAFEKALALGADMIELDVQLSRDGELVVLHDEELQRTTTGQGLVRDQRLADLKTLDAGSWFAPRFAREPVLTLNEVITLVAGRARLNVEVKAAAADFAAVAEHLIAIVRRRGIMETTLLSCFEGAALVALRDRAAGAHLGVLWQQPDFGDAWRLARELAAESIHPYWLLVSAELVAQAHERGLQVLTWTVNDITAMRGLLAVGVDGIMSDFPERFAEVGSAPGHTPP